MRTRLALICLLGAVGLPAGARGSDSVPVLPLHGTVQAAFAPWDDSEALIEDALGTARRDILVQAYLLTSKRIGAALLAAHRRGVAVRILADADQHEKTPSSQLPKLAAAGLPIWLETRYQNAHNKIIVIDAHGAEPAVITGSYNFTWTAQHKNAENLLIIRGSPELALRYASNWERHRRDAMPYK
ncbi:PLD-like domain-containing protein [Noviherbaspirillum humi]|uniref:phospholipase D n=1 Tax=Noviherbaspirillum humi TaxID=1688639 RepID=A0A239DX39_9BURK|nr:phospholipase D family protein [Noviherbaspirillum humi]SNS36917.1 PLD-like domain-containing protein [Noviherbaspirillum humi]